MWRGCHVWEGIAKPGEQCELNLIDIRQGDSTVPWGRENSIGDCTRHWRVWLISKVAPRLNTFTVATLEEP
jgi:hypothetical protein